MNKYLITAVCCPLFLLMSCKDNPSSKDTKSQTEEMNMENTLAVLKGIETGDLSIMNNFNDEDDIDHVNGTYEIKGLENVKKILADIHNHVSNLKMHLIAHATDGDYEFSIIKMTGTTKDTMMGMPANTLINRTSVGILRKVNGKGKEHWRYEIQISPSK